MSGSLHAPLAREPSGGAPPIRNKAPGEHCGCASVKSAAHAPCSECGAKGHGSVAPSRGASSHGESLDGDTRSLMESRFGRDFGQVRVHRDANASGLCSLPSQLQASEGSWRAEQRKAMLVSRPEGRAGAIRHAMSGVECGAGPRFLSAHRTDAPSISQLLAGTLSSPGRSPDTARVHPCEGCARAPRPSSRFPERLA